jgi:hypothetical protein
MDTAPETPSWEELYRYWLDRHAGGKPPTRAAIDPMIDLHHMASHLVLIDIVDGRAEYRLVGSQVVSHFGADRTGKPVGSSNVDPTQVAAWSKTVEHVAAQDKPYMLVSHYPGAEKSKVIALLMPLTPEADGVGKVFAGLFFGMPFPDTAAYPDLPVRMVALGG